MWPGHSRDPLDEFHREAIPAFREFLTEVDDNTVDTFAAAEFTSDTWNLEDEGMVRPSATWTYMVHDNPFGTELERFLVNGAKLLFGKR